MVKIIMIIYIVIIFPIVVLSETCIENDFIAEDYGKRWTVKDSPYIIIGNTHLVAGHLEIEPGVAVIFIGDYTLTIDGGASISAYGIEENQILFDSESDYHYFWQIVLQGDPDAHFPQDIYSTGFFYYCEFANGGVENREGDLPSYGGVICCSSYTNLEVNNCTFHDNNGSAVNCTGAHYNLSIMNNLIYHHQSGIRVAGKSGSNFGSRIIRNSILEPIDWGIFYSGDCYGFIADNIITGFDNNSIVLGNNIYEYMNIIDNRLDNNTFIQRPEDKPKMINSIQTEEKRYGKNVLSKLMKKIRK